VSIRTLAYIGGVFTGREAADQVGGLYGSRNIRQLHHRVAALVISRRAFDSIGLLNLFPCHYSMRPPFVLCG